MTASPPSPENTTPAAINPDAMYRARECAQFFGVCRSTWWHWTNTGRARRGIKWSPRITVWEGAYLLELKQQLIAEAQCGEV